MPESNESFQSPPFQFSLASLFVVVTGVCVGLSLVLWHSTFGLMATILVVGSGWSLAAVRAGHRRLAYVLAAPALGVVGHWVLAIPMAVVAAINHAPEMEFWFNPLAVLWMSAATTAAALILRKRILAPAPKVSTGTVIAAIYLTAAIFPIIWGLFAMGYGLLIGLQDQHTDAFAVGMLICLIGVVLSAVLATLTLPLTVPLSMLCCAVLRKLDPPKPETTGAVVQDTATAGL